MAITRIALAVAVCLLACSSAQADTTTVWAVGDGGVTGPSDDLVAERIDRGDIDHLLYLGDVYESGTAFEWAHNYGPSFGRFKRITSPTPGNHDWPKRASGYDRYWGRRVRQPGGGRWYSLDIAGWHIVSLNSLEPLYPDSRQIAWLRRDLARRPGTCTIAFEHHPRHSAGFHPDTLAVEPAWAELTGRAVVLLSGHDHDYQRFRPERGIVQFVAGTGGAELNPVRADPRLAARDSHWGALRLRLTRGKLRHEFVRVDGRVLDRGSLRCRPHDSSLLVLAPRAHVVYQRGPRVLRGRLREAAGAARLTLVRRSKSGCRVLLAGRFKRSACGTRRALIAGDLHGWRLSPLGRRRLPAGSYRLTARAVGRDGRPATQTVRFRVR